jgi:hypothetical protein
MSRREVSFTIQTEDGPKTVTVLSAVSVDDVTRVALGSYVRSVRDGTEYATPFSRGIRDLLVRTRISQRSS